MDKRSFVLKIISIITSFLSCSALVAPIFYLENATPNSKILYHWIYFFQNTKIEEINKIYSFYGLSINYALFHLSIILLFITIFLLLSHAIIELISLKKKSILLSKCSYSIAIIDIIFSLFTLIVSLVFTSLSSKDINTDYNLSFQIGLGLYLLVIFTISSSTTSIISYNIKSK